MSKKVLTYVTTEKIQFSNLLSIVSDGFMEKTYFGVTKQRKKRYNKKREMITVEKRYQRNRRSLFRVKFITSFKKKVNMVQIHFCMHKLWDVLVKTVVNLCLWHVSSLWKEPPRSVSKWKWILKDFFLYFKLCKSNKWWFLCKYVACHIKRILFNCSFSLYQHITETMMIEICKMMILL